MAVVVTEVESERGESPSTRLRLASGLLRRRAGDPPKIPNLLDFCVDFVGEIGVLPPPTVVGEEGGSPKITPKRF